MVLWVDSRTIDSSNREISEMTASEIQDGLAEIEHELPLIMRVIARTARWVHPDTFHALPIWCPDTARGQPRYDASWENQLVSQKGILKVEENIRAASALVEALGVKAKPKNWTVCHIWGYDDENFAGRSNIVQDPCYYSCIGNMVWLPTPLKGFTDAVPRIKEYLRVCAFHLYDWACEHHDVRAAAEKVRAGYIPDGYPEEWPTGKRRILPRGTAPYSDRARHSIDRRKSKIKQQLSSNTLPLYPRESVLKVLAHWKVSL